MNLRVVFWYLWGFLIQRINKFFDQVSFWLSPLCKIPYFWKSKALEEPLFKIYAFRSCFFDVVISEVSSVWLLYR